MALCIQVYLPIAVCDTLNIIPHFMGGQNLRR